MTSTPDTATQPRSAVPKDRTWDAESVFATIADWEAALEGLVADIPKLEAFSGRLAEGAQATIEALAARDDLTRRLGHVFVYAYLDYAVETTSQDAVARFGRAQAVYGRALAAVAFIEPELLALGRDRLSEWSDESPALAPYAHYLDDLFRRGEHVRSAEVEELLGQLADPHTGPYAVYSGLVDSDLNFAAATGASGESAEVTQGSVDALLASPDRVLRRSAWESYADGYPPFATRSPRTTRRRSRWTCSRAGRVGTNPRAPRPSRPRTSRSRCSTTCSRRSSSIFRRGTATGA